MQRQQFLFEYELYIYVVSHERTDGDFDLYR